MNTKTTVKRPPIHLIDDEADILTNLALAAEHRLPGVAELLIAELGRATLHGAGTLPPHTVSMNCYVEFLDAANGSSRTMQLVYPGEADITANRISILTPVGVGLIGLQQGHVISWPDRRGRDRELAVVKVTAPPSKRVANTEPIAGAAT
ncbi:nucleoside diphosphate kinase regulator [Novosphingobium sp. BL-8H]|uniref:nucleoside diphosphate kinase regulator n=1 Tax=Novosphingobium sp. BL-8H TaxID=3127640 RepID=UPI0037584BE0